MSSFNVSQLEISFEQVAKAKTCLVTRVSPNYQYTDGRRGNQDGNAYECIMHRNGFQSVRVKVENETQPALTQEQIDAAGGAVECEVAGFIGRIYVEQATGRAQLSARADKIVSVKKAPQQ
jgi:hypothetical protein